MIDNKYNMMRVYLRRARSTKGRGGRGEIMNIRTDTSVSTRLVHCNVYLRVGTYICIIYYYNTYNDFTLFLTIFFFLFTPRTVVVRPFVCFVNVHHINAIYLYTRAYVSARIFTRIICLLKKKLYTPKDQARNIIKFILLNLYVYAERFDRGAIDFIILFRRNRPRFYSSSFSIPYRLSFPPRNSTHDTLYFPKHLSGMVNHPFFLPFVYTYIYPTVHFIEYIHVLHIDIIYYRG